MHIIALTSMLVAWAALPREPTNAGSRTPPRLRRLTIAIGLLGAGWLGLRFHRVLAWCFLDQRGFQGFVTREATVLYDYSGLDDLVEFVHTTPLVAIVTSTVWNALHAAPFLGMFQAPLLAGALLATVIVAWRSLEESSLARLAIVLFAGVAGHFVWWASFPFRPQRHLTVISVLTCCAVGCGFGLTRFAWRSSADETRRQSPLLERLAFASLCAASLPHLFILFGGWKELRAYRNEQTTTAAAVQRLAAEYPDASFCGIGWWVPREQTYLAPQSVKWCNLERVAPNAPGRRIVISSANLLHLDEENLRNDRCPTLLERIGRFEIRGCDGFDQGRAHRSS
jgi:hypothetical protein